MPFTLSFSFCSFVDMVEGPLTDADDVGIIPLTFVNTSPLAVPEWAAQARRFFPCPRPRHSLRLAAIDRIR